MAGINTTATVRLDLVAPATMYRALSGPGGPALTAAKRAARQVENRAKANLTKAGRVDTGRLRNSIRTEVVATAGAKVEVRVGTDVDYAMFVHDGTGLHGPRGAYIVPRRMRVLRWQGQGGAFVFRPRSAGMRPTPFLRDAIAQVSASDFGI